ncbi:unnamed protein product [Prorocentrum cordatum]|nr:unnamed protein product [Polarella glacialis]
MSDEAGVYAVPAVQDPGFVYESNHESQRWDINQAARTTQTTTTVGPRTIIAQCLNYSLCD